MKINRYHTHIKMKTKKEELTKQYFNSKKKLETLRDNITLKRWEILSEEYKTGKKVWGKCFTRERLAYDMDIPMTTVLRCLSLDRANNRSWELVKQKKISVFKLAMICHSKNRAFQDEIVDMTIEENLSTYQITTIRAKDFEDINKERHRLACEKGYSRKDSAYTNFSNWTERGKLFLLMDKNYLPENKLGEVKTKLTKLKDDIKIYLRNFE